MQDGRTSVDGDRFSMDGDRITWDGEIGEEIRRLAYFEDMRSRRAWITRAVVLVIAMGLLFLNTYLLFLSTSAIILNVDLVRLEQSDQADLLHARLDRLDRDLFEVYALLAPPQPETSTALPDPGRAPETGGIEVTALAPATPPAPPAEP